MRRAAELLGQAGSASAADFEPLYMDADLKAVVLLLLAERRPARRSDTWLPPFALTSGESLLITWPAWRDRAQARQPK